MNMNIVVAVAELLSFTSGLPLQNQVNNIFNIEFKLKLIFLHNQPLPLQKQFNYIIKMDWMNWYQNKLKLKLFLSSQSTSSSPEPAASWPEPSPDPDPSASNKEENEHIILEPYCLREGVNWKKNVFFRALPEWWGGGLPMPEFFGPLSRSAFLVNNKSLFLQKCQCIELLTVF